MFYPNTSLYQIGNQYRYVEYTIEKKRRNYSLEGITHSEYIENVLTFANKGKTISELATVLIDDEINKEEAQCFIVELIDNQILVSELEITVTGEDYFKNILHRIQQIPKTTDIRNQLIELQKQLKNLDTTTENDIDVYRTIVNSAKNLIPELDSKYLLQTDCFTSSTNNILDRNIRLATMLGIVGAGGIGYELQSSFRMFEYPRVSAIIIVIFVTIFIIDNLSSFIRSKIK